ncbi:MAG: methyltransferase domain-containing protein [Phycisphaerales bacterium]|nr:MAG: methyltransferase domain-containing protein [Phycisphaerales bacterium]
MFAKLDKVVRDMLFCPLCKSSLAAAEDRFTCATCGTVFPKRKGVFDFRIDHPDYCTPSGMTKWDEIQKKFEEGEKLKKRKRRKKVLRSLDAIDSAKKMYTEEFDIRGSVLDVGGFQGRSRGYLSSSAVSLYVSADPFLESFEGIDSQPELLQAYPCLAEPCNFLACYAEALPFNSKTFDWVNMLSVHDHFRDPYQAMIEAYRVLKDDGHVLIGLAVTGGKSTMEADRKEQAVYVSPVVKKVLRLLKNLGMIKAAKYELKLYSAKPLDDGHMCRWQYEDLLDLCRRTNFAVTKERWLEPPYGACVYIVGDKQPLD